MGCNRIWSSTALQRFVEQNFMITQEACTAQKG